MKQEICKNCGKEVTAIGRKLFCCAECQSNHYNKNQKIKKSKNISFVIITKSCIYCGKEFKTTYKNQIYCSNKCRNRRKYLHKKKIFKKIKKICKNCGIEFETAYNNKIFCNNKCLYKMVIYKNRTCKFCGKKFIGSSGKLFCSNECMHNCNKKTIKCKFCGKDFETILHNKKYCNDECRNSMPKKHTCKFCGKKHYRKGIFCSEECLNNYRKKTVKCKICGKEFESSAIVPKYCSNKCLKKRRCNKNLTNL